VERRVEVGAEMGAEDELSDVVAHVGDAHVGQDAGLGIGAEGGGVIVNIEREIDQPEHVGLLMAAAGALTTGIGAFK
jgi:hypothetical protein